MRNYFVALLAFVAILAQPLVAHAIPTYAQGIDLSYSTGVLDGVNWTPLVASTVKSTKAVCVQQTGAYLIELGVNLAGSASSGDVRQLVIPKTANLASPVCYPLAVSQGYRISIRSMASSGAVYSGDFQLNVIYN